MILAFVLPKNSGNKEQVIYEICIPIRDFMGRDYILEDVNSKTVQLQIVINDLSKMELKEGFGRNSRGSSDRMSGEMQGGSEMQGGGGRGGMAGADQATQSGNAAKDTIATRKCTINIKKEF